MLSFFEFAHFLCGMPDGRQGEVEGVSEADDAPRLKVMPPKP